MKCLVCDKQITINTLSALLNLDPLLLCGRCNKNLIRKEATTLYEQNDWLLGIVDRLNQGDLELRKIFLTDLKMALSAHPDKKILLETGGVNAPYPWLEILATDIGVQINDVSHSTGLILSVTKLSAVENNVSII